MKLDNYNIIYQNGGTNWKKLFTCGSSQKEKITCKKQENDIKPALKTSSDNIEIYMTDEEFKKEWEEMEKGEEEEKKPLSKEEVARNIKELGQQVDKKYLNVNTDWEPNYTANKVINKYDKGKFGGGSGGKILKTFIDSISDSYVQIRKSKIAILHKYGTRFYQLKKKIRELDTNNENLTADKQKKKNDRITALLTSKRKVKKEFVMYREHIKMLETKNKNKIREFIEKYYNYNFDLKFEQIHALIISASQKKFQEEKTSLGGKTKKTKKVRKHRGIHQTGGNKGKLKKGYKYSGKRLKNGKAEIKKVKSKK